MLACFAKTVIFLVIFYLPTPSGIKAKTKITAVFGEKRHAYEVLRQEIMRLEGALAEEFQTANSIRD